MKKITLAESRTKDCFLIRIELPQWGKLAGLIIKELTCVIFTHPQLGGCKYEHARIQMSESPIILLSGGLVIKLMNQYI